MSEEAIISAVFSPKSQSDTLVIEKPIAPIPRHIQTAPALIADDDDTTPASAATQSTRLSPVHQLAFGGTHPRSESPDVVICNNCSKPVAKSVMNEHSVRCKKQPPEQQQQQQQPLPEKQPEQLKRKLEAENGATTAATPTATATATATAATTTTDQQPPAKKKKKNVKPRAPIDLSRQCGVSLPDGSQCPRTLTCKAHSVGMKRAVPNRPKPFDALVAQIRSNRTKAASLLMMDGPAGHQGGSEDDELVDSDEEVLQVMSGVGRSVARPVASSIVMPVAKKRRFWKMRELLYTALGGTRTGASIVGKVLKYPLDS